MFHHLSQSLASPVLRDISNGADSDSSANQAECLRGDAPLSEGEARTGHNDSFGVSSVIQPS